MRVSRRTQVARWGGALLVALAPLPWLGLGTAAATDGTTDAQGAPGNNGTLKVHEQGTPSGTESNDPKVCIFNFEGFSFDEGQTGVIFMDGQGQTSGWYGPVSFGPADGNGYYATVYVNDGGLAVPDGHYKATLYGKQLPGGELSDVKAKSKVFKIDCGSPEPTDSQTTDTASSSSAPETTEMSTPVTSPETTITEGSSSAAVLPTHTDKTHKTNKGHDASASVLPTRLTQAAALPHTGPGVPVGAALAASLLLIGLGSLLLLGPGRLATQRYQRRH